MNKIIITLLILFPLVLSASDWSKTQDQDLIEDGVFIDVGKKSLNLIETLNTDRIKYIAVYRTLNQLFNVQYPDYINFLKSYLTVDDPDNFCYTPINKNTVAGKSNDLLQKFFIATVINIEAKISQSNKINSLTCMYNSEYAISMIAYSKKNPNKVGDLIMEKYTSNKSKIKE